MPKVGDTVHFYHVGYEHPLAATVVHVPEAPAGDAKPDAKPLVNLAVFSSNGDVTGKCDVKFVAEPTGEEDFDCCVAIEPEAKAKAKKSSDTKHAHP